MSRLAVVGAIAALGIGCTTGELRSTPREAALLVRTGLGCAQGCANDRALLVGTQEVAEVIGLGPVGDDLLVAVDDVSIATAWVESVRLCCDDADLGACRAMDPTEVECAGRESDGPRVVIRALRPGRTSIQIGNDGGELGWEPIEVADAASVSVIDRIADRGHFDGDTLDRGLGDAGLAPWIDGRLDHVDVRAGTTAHLRLVARGSDGRMLLASEGITARIDDASVAELGSAFGACDGDAMEGEALVVEGVEHGAATVEVRAGSARASFTVAVGASCEPHGEVVLSDDACESDADCAPVECCHASACGAVSSAPSCDDAVCSLECREGTIDCGGSCLCVEGRCAAFIPGPQDPRCEQAPPELEPIPPLPPPF